MKKAMMLVLSVCLLSSLLALPAQAAEEPMIYVSEGSESVSLAALGKGCWAFNLTLNVQEGSVNVDTAKVSLIGQTCTAADGTIANAKTTVSAGIHVTAWGATAGGLSYWSRGYRVLENSNSRETTRFYFGYQSCFVKIVPICGPGNPQFYFDVNNLVAGGQRTIGYSAVIHNNSYGAAKWS